MSSLHRISLFDSGWFHLGQLSSLAKDLNDAMRKVMPPNLSGGYGGVVALHGPMGAGKTTLVNALCDVWGVEDGTSSATFGIVNCYQAGEWEIFHQDWYRLKGEDEAWDLGLSEYFNGSALNLVEWPERAPDLIPSDALLLEFEVEAGVDFPNRKVILWQLEIS